MSVMVVWASPNVDGLTAAAKDRIVEGITRAGGTAESLHLCRQKLQSCQACGNGWVPLAGRRAGVCWRMTLPRFTTG